MPIVNSRTTHAHAQLGHKLTCRELINLYTLLRTAQTHVVTAMAEGEKDVEMKDVSDDKTEETKDQTPTKKDKDLLTIEGILCLVVVAVNLTSELDDRGHQLVHRPRVLGCGLNELVQNGLASFDDFSRQLQYWDVIAYRSLHMLAFTLQQERSIKEMVEVRQYVTVHRD